MSIVKFSISRPVTTTMIYFGAIILGLIALVKLPQELFPPITYPQLTVMTAYPNAAPEEVETLITKFIEEAVGTVKNVRRISSISREGVSLVTVEFNWGTDMNFAALGMREKIDLIKERLPREADEPIVMKFNPFALPVMTLNITSGSDISQQDLLEISRSMIKDNLEKVEGVASATISGGIGREIHVDIDAAKLIAAKVDLIKIAEIIRDSNLNYPAGAIEEKFFEWLVRTMGEFEKVKDFDKVAVGVDEKEEIKDYYSGIEPTNPSKRLIMLKDIASVSDGLKERTSYSRFNGKENISISIQKQAEANTIQTVNRVKKALKRIREIIPKGVNIDIVYDQSNFIKGSISGVTDAAIQGGILAFIILLIFLKNLKSSLITITCIPTSIFITFSFMYFQGISVNMISLGGLALGVGMLVDGAIVVVENVFRHVKLGENQLQATEFGTKEVSTALLATHLTSVVVFLPMIFIVGIAGQIFKQLAFTVTYSLMASLLVALTLTPMLSLIGKGTGKDLSHLKIFKYTDIGINKVMSFYQVVLPKFLKRKYMYLGLVLIIFLGSLVLFAFIKKEFMPKVDEGQFLIKLDMPTGTKLDITNNVAKKIEDAISGMKYVESVSTQIGSNKEESISQGVFETLGSYQAQIVINLKKKRRMTTDEFIQNLKNRLNKVNLENGTVEYILSQSLFQSAMQGGGAPIVIEIKGPNPKLDKLKVFSEEVMEKIGHIKGIYGVKNDLQNPAPETKIEVDKDKAYLYNLSVKDIAQTAQIAIGGWVATKFKENGKEIDVRIRLRKSDRSDFYALKQIMIQTPQGYNIPLDALTKISQGFGPSEIKRLDNQETVLVTANVYKRSINSVISDINQSLKNIKVPPNYSIKLAGENEQMKESFDSLIFALILSIVLIYMIMASEFESFWQPFVIMFTMPISLIGVALALLFTNTSLNAVSALGIIILGGIIVDNGILLIDFVNMAKEKGMSSYEACIAANNARIRPILMTALTAVFGLLPLALGLGEGAQLQSSMAISLMGGLIVGTFLTLIVIPALYLVAEELTAKFKK